MAKTDITAEDTFSPGVLKQARDDFDVAVWGTFVATVTVQVSKDNATWIDVDETTTPAVMTANMASAWYVRAGVKTGNFTSGTVSVEVF